MDKLTNKSILILIVSVATLLRFYNLFEIPFTHDEFSALFRLRFDNFSDLIEKGVKVDGHPAGIHVFLYYWIKLFGRSEWVVKLPFIIFGIASVVLIYQIAKKWFNETVGLLSATYLATIQYTVMYSQIARPYISGLFFSLLMVYYWTNLIKTPERHFYKNLTLYIFSASLCAYNHHFSLLFAAIVGISGLFFIPKKYLTPYIVAGIAIFILYVPHLNIFFYQLGVGGVESWLGKPHNDFIIRFIEYIFNYSILTITATLGVVVYALKNKGFNKVSYRQYVLFVMLFLLPFLIGFFYSRYASAVLQFSVLIFSFSYLFFVLFGFIKEQSVKTNLLLVSIMLMVNTFSLVVERQHYKLFYKSVYEQLLLDANNVKKQKKNVLSVLDSHKRITGYYIKKHRVKNDFIWFDSLKNIAGLKLFLEKNSSNYDYFYFGGTSFSQPLTVPLIKEYFPTLEWQNNYAGGTSYLFSKSKSENSSNVVEVLNFENNNYNKWTSIEQKNRVDSVSYDGNYSYLINSETEWGPTYSNSLENIIKDKNNFIDITLKAKGELDKAVLVATLDASEGNIHWSGTDFSTFTQKAYNKEWVTVHHSVKLADVHLNYDDIQLKVFVWNQEKGEFLIDDIKITLRTGNPVLYGLFEPVPIGLLSKRY